MKTEIKQKYMEMAMAKAREGAQSGQTPFGACVVRGDEVLSCEHNVVWNSVDITAHAEIHAIRQACRHTGSIDLSGAVIYSTCEPCPMCFSACHWARIDTIFYGADIADAAAVGFNELSVSNRELCSLGSSPVKIVPHVCLDANRELLQQWSRRADSKSY